MAVKKTNKSEAIRALLKQGMSRPAIAKKLGVSPQLVYVVWRNANKGAKVRSVNVKSKRTTAKFESATANEFMLVLGYRFFELMSAYIDIQKFKARAK